MQADNENKQQWEVEFHPSRPGLEADVNNDGSPSLIAWDQESEEAAVAAAAEFLASCVEDDDEYGDEAMALMRSTFHINPQDRWWVPTTRVITGHELAKTRAYLVERTFDTRKMATDAVERYEEFGNDTVARFLDTVKNAITVRVCNDHGDEHPYLIHEDKMKRAFDRFVYLQTGLFPHWFQHDAKDLVVDWDASFARFKRDAPTIRYLGEVFHAVGREVIEFCRIPEELVKTIKDARQAEKDENADAKLMEAVRTLKAYTQGKHLPPDIVQDFEIDVQSAIKGMPV